MTWKIFASAVILSAAACGQEEQAAPENGVNVETGAGAAGQQVNGARPETHTVQGGGSGSDGGAGGNGGSNRNGGGGDDEMRWLFARTAAGPKLSYGEPQTDNVRLLLRCSGDELSVNFIRPADVVSSRPDQLTIASGGMQWTANVSAEESQIGGMSISATAPLSSAPITAFASGRPLEVRWGEETIRVPGTDQARQFLSACG